MIHGELWNNFQTPKTFRATYIAREKVAKLNSKYQKHIFTIQTGCMKNSFSLLWDQHFWNWVTFFPELSLKEEREKILKKKIRSYEKKFNPSCVETLHNFEYIIFSFVEEKKNFLSFSSDIINIISRDENSFVKSFSRKKDFYF